MSKQITLHYVDKPHPISWRCDYNKRLNSARRQPADLNYSGGSSPSLQPNGLFCTLNLPAFITMWEIPENKSFTWLSILSLTYFLLPYLINLVLLVFKYRMKRFLFISVWLNMLFLFLTQNYIFLLYSYNPQSMFYRYFCIICLVRSYLATSFLIVFVEAYIKIYSEAILVNYPNSVKLEFLQGDARFHLKCIYNLLGGEAVVFRTLV